MIINYSADPLGTKRKRGDYLCYIFEDKITRNSEVEIKIISKDNNSFELIENRYDTRSGLVADNNNNSDIYKLLVSNIKTINMPLNQILYGPPGTGKTDSTIEKALQILEFDSSEKDLNKYRTSNRDTFKSLLNDQIFFVTMHPSYSYEDFVQGIKPYVQNKHKEFNKIIIVTHIQDDTANEAVNNYKEDITKEYTYDNLVRNFSLIDKDTLVIVRDRENLIGFAEVSLIESEPFKKQFVKCPNCGKADLRKRKNKVPKYLCVDCRHEFDEAKIEEKDVTKYTARFKSAMTPLNIPKETINDDIINYNPQVSIQEVKSSALDKVMDSNQGNGTLLFKMKDGIFLKVCKIAKLNKDQKYILIIDEINRANISKVFGELITLIEQDKRLGNENELSVLLPSGENFSVPKNLYIIGTMNTADKSIALVDIALRRRFQFVPVYPSPDVIMKFCKSSDKEEKSKFMSALNLRLRNDKGVDFQIGHAYFLNENFLIDVINENIVPLLIEYFRNDLEKVKGMMKDLNKTIDEDHYNNTGLLKYIG